MDYLILEPQTTTPQPHLCADAGYQGETARQQVIDHGFIPHIRSRGDEKKEKQEGKHPRRWVEEVLFSWLNRFHKILVRFEKKVRNDLGLFTSPALSLSGEK